MLTEIRTVEFRPNFGLTTKRAFLWPQVEQLLMRELGLTAEDQEDVYDDDDDDELHT